MKGSLHEYELDLLRQRAWEARRQKASRGELVLVPPVGFVNGVDGEVEMDPDQRVQEAIRLVYRKFFELGSARQTLFWLIEKEVKLPCRRIGIAGRETHWRRPAYPMVYRILTNPIYAGAYAYGKTEVVSGFQNGIPTKSIRQRQRENWIALIPERYDGYVSWDDFERVQRMLSDNYSSRAETTRGAAKCGEALLAGLLRCRRCGRKLMVLYTGRNGDIVRYSCCRGNLDSGEPRCISFGGTDVDRSISQELLRVVRPAAIEAAVKAGEQTASQRDDVLMMLERDLENARYVTSRAAKQYDLADPENRLVAEQLEARWNEALSHVGELEKRIQDDLLNRELSTPPTLEEFRTVAEDLNSVWSNSGTDVRLKKRILRTVIKEILVDLDEAAGQIFVVIHWQGGVHTQFELRRRRTGQNRLHTSPEIADAIRQLVHIGTDANIAGWLNRAGLQTGRGNRWTQERVASFRSKRGVPVFNGKSEEASNWFNLHAASEFLGISHTTLRKAIDRGVIKAEHPVNNGPWLLRRDELETPQAKALADRVQHYKRGAAPGPGQNEFVFPDT